MALILDTGPLYAALDRTDSSHPVCRYLIETTIEPLVLPAPVLVEVNQLVLRRMHPGVFLTLLDDISAGGLRVEEL